MFLFFLNLENSTYLIQKRKETRKMLIDIICYFGEPP